MRHALWILLLLAGPTFAQQPAPEEARLLRFPTIQGSSLAFSYAGNLYTVPATGGIARKLTSHEGYEMFAHFSPDGQWLAFTGQYDGNTEVYLMPAQGGVPKRLTYTATLTRDEISDRMGPNNIVMGWKNPREIIFRSRMRDPNDFIGQLFTVSIDGTLPEQIPVPRGGFCSFSPDGTKLAYNRIFREFRTWKRYRGGMADEIWVHDFQTKTTTQITDNPACDTFPMWVGDRIYFLSDRGDEQRFNLYSYDLASKTTRRHTDFADFDIKFPSLGDSAIVFENAGYIYRFDLKEQKAAKIPIRILDDMITGRGGLRDVSQNIVEADIAPDGKRAIFSARGEIFSVPAKEGITRNLTATSGAHERDPSYSPDGKWIACNSDITGEDEIHLYPADGSGPPQQLTSAGGPYKYTPRWSPDSKKILWSDKKLRLHMVDVASKEIKLVDQAKSSEIHDYAWSSDSKWIAFARPERESMGKVVLYSVEKDQTTEVTDGWYRSHHPAFSSDGKYLFFVSERDFTPTYSSTEWNHAYQDMSRIYLVTLAKDTPSPFRPKSEDEPKEEKKDDKKDEKKDDKEKKKEVAPIKIDLEGLKDRVLQLPVPAGNYNGLHAAGNSIYYFRNSKKGGGSFQFFDLASKKETDLGKIDSYEISANGQKMLVAKSKSYSIIDLPKATINPGDSLDLSGLQIKLDRQAEWKQIFNEAWRQMRDYFYDPGMHGNDWKAIRAKYEVLVPHVNHRADLTYIIGEMVSELNAGHAYVGGGDLPSVSRVKTGLLGADLRYDRNSQTFQITKILPGTNWDKSLRSPLAELGVDVRTGDYILAVNGRSTTTMKNIYESLVGTVGKQVKLKVATDPAGKETRDVTVVPIGDEHELVYYGWVQSNIKRVSDATQGRVGYLHIPDMGLPGLNEFAKHYYPQLRKKALIIDVRGNGGGNVSPMIIERLRRDISMINLSRDTVPNPNPPDVMLGPKVCLMNEYSASDGDIFPYRFRNFKLGKLVGKRSWGGTIGIRGSLPFVDGGQLMKPEFASYELDGKKWAIEGHGVDPDIVVDNDPAREFAGTDDQLERAIAVILEDLRTQERNLPAPPPFPKR